jgi:hypothetical protein
VRLHMLSAYCCGSRTGGLGVVNYQGSRKARPWAVAARRPTDVRAEKYLESGARVELRRVGADRHRHGIQVFALEPDVPDQRVEKHTATERLSVFRRGVDLMASMIAEVAAWVVANALPFPGHADRETLAPSPLPRRERWRSRRGTRGMKTQSFA